MALVGMQRSPTTRILAGLLLCLAAAADGGSSSRLRRYVVFPEGSSFSVALCMTMHTLSPDNVFTEGLNWGVSYDLPNESRPEARPPQRRSSPGQAGYLQRRQRRDLYVELERIVDAMGSHGRSCVLRALCEAAQRFAHRPSGLLEQLMRIVFSLPLDSLFSFEPPEHRSYVEAQRAGQQAADCPAAFPRCAFSLIDMALGEYDAPYDLSAASAGPLHFGYAMK